MLSLRIAQNRLRRLPGEQFWCWVYLVFVLAVCALTGCGVSNAEAGYAAEGAIEEGQDKIFLGSTTLERYAANERHPAFIVFARDGKELLKETAKPEEKLTLVSVPIDNNDDKRIIPCADAPGDRRGKRNYLFNLAIDGIPAVVVERQKENGTFDYEIFRLSRKVEKLATIANGYARIQMQTTNIPGCYEILANDCFTDYSGARSVAPEILLAYQSGALTLDCKGMQKPAPDRKQLKLMRKAIKSEFQRLHGQVPPELAAEVLDLYYSGNAKQARAFFNSAWAGPRAAKADYWDYLMTEAAHSPYWRDILAMNNSVEK